MAGVRCCADAHDADRQRGGKAPREIGARADTPVLSPHMMRLTLLKNLSAKVRPTLGVIMETEVWPNLMHEMTAHGIPVVLANARESEKSRAQAQKAIEVMGPAFGSFAAVLAQSDEDKARLESLGAKDVLVTGSVKFDIVPDASQMAAAKAWLTVLSRPVVLLASTRDGEEAAFLESFKSIRHCWQRLSS